MIRVLSLGGGVQSICVARMSFAGELPPLDHMIFADTGRERRRTYEHVEELERECRIRGIGFHRVRNLRERAATGDLLVDLMQPTSAARWGAPPLYTRNPDGSLGQIRRQCTGDYKKDPIWAKFRELCGIESGGRGPKEIIAEQWIGISADEKQRMKAADRRWYRVWHPLIEGARPMTRGDCLKWFQDHGVETPPKSACTFCPYQADRRWIDIKRNDPEDWATIVELDRHLRNGLPTMTRGELYLHRSRLPLEEAIAAAERELDRSPTFDLEGFEDECHGVCGV